jgi:hypothetical protein
MELPETMRNHIPGSRATRIVGFALALGLVPALASCVAPDRPRIVLGGVEAQQVDARTWRLVLRYRDFPSAALFEDFVLLQAAQTTIAHGGTHFIVLPTTRNAISWPAATWPFAPSLTPIEDITIFTVRPGARPPDGALDANFVLRSVRARLVRAAEGWL